MNTVVIAAAGNSTRMNGVNKILQEIFNKPVIYWTLSVFEHSKHVDTVILVVREKDLLEIKRLIKTWSLKKVKSIITGGRDRQESIWLGIQEADKLGFADNDLFIMHDGSRPLIESQEIHKAIDATNRFGASVVAVRAKDTVKLADDNYQILQTLDRNHVWLVQTPQAAPLGIVKKAFKKAVKENFFATDVAGILEHYGISVKIVEGNYKNIKITTPDDLDIVKSFLAKNLKV